MIVDVTVRNSGNKREPFYGQQQTLTDRAGRQYGAELTDNVLVDGDLGDVKWPRLTLDPIRLADTSNSPAAEGTANNC